jgi:hypothetical protein
MPQIRITLPTDLTAERLRAVLKYFERAGRLSPNEWKLVFAAFDALGKAELAIGRRRLSFRQFYDREVDRRWADSFITRLTTDSEAEVEALQQKTAFEIIGKSEREDHAARLLSNFGRDRIRAGAKVELSARHSVDRRGRARNAGTISTSRTRTGQAGHDAYDS